jgi:hypothetical protein
MAACHSSQLRSLFELISVNFICTVIHFIVCYSDKYLIFLYSQGFSI